MKNFIALLLFASAGTAWYFYQQYSKAKEELAALSLTLAPFESNVEGRRADVQAFVRMLEAQKKLQAKKVELAEILEKERKILDTTKELSRERSGIISGSRQAVVGQLIPELTLTDGRKLAQVRILKVEDGAVSVSLPSGVQKIAPAELPLELRQRLHFQ